MSLTSGHVCKLKLWVNQPRSSLFLFPIHPMWRKLSPFVELLLLLPLVHCRYRQRQCLSSRSSPKNLRAKNAEESFECWNKNSWISTREKCLIKREETVWFWNVNVLPTQLIYTLFIAFFSSFRLCSTALVEETTRPCSNFHSINFEIQLEKFHDVTNEHKKIRQSSRILVTSLNDIE